MKKESSEFSIIFCSIFVMAIGGYFVHLSIYEINLVNLIQMVMGIGLILLGFVIIANKFREIKEENLKLYS